MKITVTIVDDHPVVINGIQKIIAEYDHLELYHSCSDERSLLASLRMRQPDVLLMDIQMQGKQGDELAKTVLQQYPDIAILALTNLDQPFHVRNMFLNGARGYILKTASPDNLIRAIETVYNGAQYIDNGLRNRMLNDILISRTSTHTIPTLTKREKEILELIAEELTSQEIAQKLFISLSAVENHRLNLLFKLNVKNAVGLVRKAMQMGLIKS